MIFIIICCQQVASWAIVSSHMWGRIFTSIIVMSGLVGCLSLGKSRHPDQLRFHDQQQEILVENGPSFEVGKLPENWKILSRAGSALSFQHPDGGTIGVGANCGEKFEDLPLSVLIMQLVSHVDNRQVEKSSEFMLDWRGAKRRLFSGTTDGVPLKYDVVVVKKNRCVIDFIYVAHPENYSSHLSDFENFYRHFHL